jgi:ArsR family transcriptional regulator
MDPCSEKLKVISNPQRLKILEFLSTEKLNVSEIQERIDIPQNLLSYHLKVLEENEFIQSERDGRHIYYRNTKNLSVQNNKLTINLKCCELNF